MIFLEVLQFKQIGFLTPFMQILIICGLFTLALVTQRKEYKRTGKTYGRYPWRISTFLSSTYEEIIFRGFILYGLLMFLTPVWSIVISSILFGLWHIKNYKWQTKKETIHQVLYAGLVFGPLACLFVLWTETIWVAVIIHYIHNLIAYEYEKIPLKNRFMMVSNIFLGLPVLFAAIYHEWLYCFFASGLFVFSPLFHFYRIHKPHSVMFRIYKVLDWMFAISAFVYMYYYIYEYAHDVTQSILFLLLSSVVFFFWYGWKRVDYEKYHPWFHIVAPIVSSAILILAHFYKP